MPDCLFCKIIKKEEKSYPLYEDDDVIVIMDAFPDCDGHALVIPKKHIDSIMDVDDATIVKVMETAKIWGDKIMKKLDCHALSLVINYGGAQVIKHLHVHILPDHHKKATHTVEEIYNILKD